MTGKRIGEWLMPLVLVCIGIILLLNTTGVVSWSVWGEAWKCWPVLLIGFGLHLLLQNLRRR